MLELRRLLPLIALLLALSGTYCSSGEQTGSEQAPAQPFFDLKGYFQKEIARLDSLKPKAVKQVEVNRQVEVQPFDTADYALELKSFLDSDINKPSWYDKYRVDTIRGDGITLQYDALDDDLMVRTVRVKLRADTVQTIEVIRKSSSLVEKLVQQLHYIPNEGYTISASQESNVGKDSELQIRVRWE